LAIAALGAFSGGPATAQGASFGSKVLLCSAATSPGWPSIPYCVPVMQTLFRILAKGGSWPSCPEANTTVLATSLIKPARKDRRRFRLGMTPAQRRPKTPMAISVPTCRNRSRIARRIRAVARYPMTSRAMRSEPHFVDITTANGIQRFHFSLRGY